jgi:NAD(P)-dependent dehydrogenase (short-subunit alcohol dehydrogenase family)
MYPAEPQRSLVTTIGYEGHRMGSCRGRVALVTGSSRGLGRVIARKLSEAGADLIINYRQAGGRSETQARALAKELVERGSRAVAIQADIGQKDAVAAMFQQIGAEFGRLDILVLNAARAPFKKAGELLKRDLLELVETNYLGNVYCMQQALPLMQARPDHVMFISSLSSRFALPNYPLGSMKAAMESLVKQWATELRDRHITVNGITVGLLKTDSLIVLRQYWPGVERLPASAFVELDDVAGVVLFLCTDAARSIRGQNLVVDNGLSNELLHSAHSS